MSPTSRLDHLRTLEAERQRLLGVDKPALEARWMRALGAAQLQALAMEIDCKRWTAIVARMRDGLAAGELPPLHDVQRAVHEAMRTDFDRLERWKREVDAASAPPAPATITRARPAAADQPYAAAREGVTAPHVFNLAQAIASLEAEIETIRTQPPFTYAALLDDPEWIAEQREQFEIEAAALATRRDQARQLAELLALGPLG